MMYASTKQALRDALTGPLVEVQATDASEVAKETGRLFMFHSLLSLNVELLFILGSQWRRESNAVRMLVGLPGCKLPLDRYNARSAHSNEPCLRTCTYVSLLPK